MTVSVKVGSGSSASIPPIPDVRPSGSCHYLHRRRETIGNAARQWPLLPLWDKNMIYVGQITQERSVRVEEIMADTGGGSVVIRRDNWLSNFMARVALFVAVRCGRGLGASLGRAVKALGRYHRPP